MQESLTVVEKTERKTMQKATVEFLSLSVKKTTKETDMFSRFEAVISVRKGNSESEHKGTESSPISAIHRAVIDCFPKGSLPDLLWSQTPPQGDQAGIFRLRKKEDNTQVGSVSIIASSEKGNYELIACFLIDHYSK